MAHVRFARWKNFYSGEVNKALQTDEQISDENSGVGQIQI
jgi:hypothetical protein